MNARKAIISLVAAITLACDGVHWKWVTPWRRTWSTSS